MYGFIRLHESNSNDVVLVNPAYIVAVTDYRNDPAVRDNKNWQRTLVVTTKVNYSVLETEGEIIELIINKSKL